MYAEVLSEVSRGGVHKVGQWEGIAPVAPPFCLSFYVPVARSIICVNARENLCSRKRIESRAE